MGVAKSRRDSVMPSVHTGGPGPTVSFTKGGFYYGDKKESAWVNDLNYREMLTKEQVQQAKYYEANEAKEQELTREREDRAYQEMVERVGHGARMPGPETWRRSGGGHGLPSTRRLMPISQSTTHRQRERLREPQTEAEKEMIAFLSGHSFDKYIADKEIKRSIRKMRRRMYELQRAQMVLPSHRSVITTRGMHGPAEGRHTVN